MDNKTSTIKLNIICPDSSCATKKEITVPAENLKHSETGIITISISKGLVCNHSFQVFVDLQGRVRGYKKPDFELSFSPTQDYTEEKTDTKGSTPERILQGLRVILGEEIFYKIIRSTLCKFPIYLITDIPSIQEMLDGFKIILKKYNDDFTICTLQEYNLEYRPQLAASKVDNSLVVAVDQRIIFNQSFDSRYNPKKFSLEKSMLELINLNQTNEITIQHLQDLFDNVLDTSNRIKIDMQHEKIDTKKDLKSRVTKIINKKLTLDNETVENIVTNRYAFDVDEYFKERSRASEWGKGILDLAG